MSDPAPPPALVASAEGELPANIVEAINALAYEARAFYCAPEAWEVVQARAALDTAILSRLTAAEAERDAAIRERDEERAMYEAWRDNWRKSYDQLRDARDGEIADCTAALARAERAEKAQWQPIATAPKDDEESILVCDARVAGGFHQVVWWHPDSKRPGWHWDTSDGPTFHQDAFTHWMPLPVHPAPAEEEKS